MIAMSELRTMLRLKRAARRWLVIAYSVFVLLFVGLLAMAGRAQGPDFVNRLFFWFWWTLVVFPVFLRSMVTSSKRGSNLQTLMKPAESGRGFESRPLDERELGLHERMHTKAYYILQILIPVCVLLVTPLEVHRYAWMAFVRIPALWLLSLLVTSLPDAMILWTEPDMEDSE